MNAARRKTLADLYKRLAHLRTEQDDINTEAGNIRSELETVRDEEQEARDAMPESLQGGEAGEKSQSTIDEMESAMSNLEDIENDDGEKFDDALTSIDNAKGEG